MARTFFYVCAGLFLLALSWHLGARAARAGSGFMEAADFADGYGAAAVINRHLWRIQGPNPPEQIPPAIPGASPVIACSVNGVVLENGEAWLIFGGPGTWEWSLIGTFPGGPTPAEVRTWGSVKARYR